MDVNISFEKALERFLDSLSDNDRLRYAPCASAEDLVEGLEKLSILAKKSQGKSNRKAFQIIELFCSRLKPFFDVLSLFAQADAKASVIWGSLRLVLQLGSNFASFFEKLIRMISRLTETFPQYEQLAKVCACHASSTASKFIKSHMEEVYVDLLDFFQSVARVFTNCKGKVKGNIRLFGHLAWTPFDSRFTDLLERMSYHRELLQLDLQLFQAEIVEAVDLKVGEERLLAAEERQRSKQIEKAGSIQMDYIREELVRQRKETSLHRIVQWLSAPLFSNALGRAQAVREEGTNEWIFNDVRYIRWRDRQSSVDEIAKVQKSRMGSNVVWIHGTPGSGKTILASSIVHELNLSLSDTEGVLYFFFQAEHPSENNRDSAYRSMLCQIIQQSQFDEFVLDKFLFMRAESSMGDRTAPLFVLSEILKICLNDAKNYTLIFDGIDECADKNDLLHDIRTLAANSNRHWFALFSRRNVPQLVSSVLVSCQIEMDKSSVGEDIQIYLQSQLEGLVNDRLLPEGADASELTNSLVESANGMFLWARLMASYLASPALTKSMRLQTIEEVVLLEGLEAMYQKIIESIQSLLKPEREMASRIFAWIIHGKISIDAGLLQDAVMTGRMKESYTDNLENFLETATFVCANLIEFQEARIGLEFRKYPCFIHQSVREYFVQLGDSAPNGTTSTLIPPTCIAHLLLAERCFMQLQQRSKSENEGITSPRFKTYAAHHAMHHLSATRKFLSLPLFKEQREWNSIAEDMVEACTLFVHDPHAVSQWLELYYLSFREYFGTLDTLAITTWADWAVESSCCSIRNIQLLATDLRDFAADLKNIEESWGEKLRKTPGIVWHEVSAFLKSRFLLRSTSTKVKFLNSKKPNNDLSSSVTLCTVSKTTSDGKQTGVLSVWPSKAYEDHLHNLQSGSSLDSLLRFCSGWIATYEIWSTSDVDPAKIHTIHIKLKETEVSLLMRQSFREELTLEWKASCPLAINTDLSSIVILRTVFVFNPGVAADHQLFTYANIDVASTSSNSRYWSPNLEAFEPKNRTIKNLPAFLKSFHHDWYTYSFTFSPTGKSLLFHDAVQSGCKSLLFREPLSNTNEQSLAMFRRSSHNSILFEKISQYDCSTDEFRPSFQPDTKEFVFHHQFEIVFFISDSHVYVWEYEKGTPPRILTTDTDCPAPEIKKSDLRISMCGNYVLLGTDHVIPIPVDILRNGSTAESSETSKTSESLTVKSSNALTRLATLDVADFGLQRGQLVRGSEACIREDGSSRMVSTHGQLQIEVGGGQNSRLRTIQKLNIAHLPDTIESRYLEPIIKVPEEGSSFLQVVLDRKLQPGYGLNKRAADGSAIVLNRDIRMISATEVYNPQYIQGEEEGVKYRTTDPSMYRAVNLGESEETLAFEDVEQSMAKRFKSS